MVGAGYCPVAEAVEWADGVIAREVAPLAAVLDVSLTGRASPATQRALSLPLHAVTHVVY